MRLRKRDGIPNCTVSRIKERFKKFETTASLEEQGAIKKTTTSIDCNIILQIKKIPV